MRVHGHFRSDREALKALGIRPASGGPPLEPVRTRPTWLQRLFGVRWDKPQPKPDRNPR